MIDYNALVRGANLSIRVVSKRLIEDIAEQKTINAKNDNFAFALHVRIVIQFALLELTCVAKALLNTKHPYAKRYHNKNLKAYSSECYKMLYHFGKARKHSIWSKFEGTIAAIGDTELTERYKDITKQLATFGDTQIDKPLRDITMHYDEDMLAVYDKTVALKSEDAAAKYYCDFNDILRQMLQLATDVVVRLDEPAEPATMKLSTDLLDNGRCSELQNNQKLRDDIDVVIVQGPKEMDATASLKRRLEHTLANMKIIVERLPKDQAESLLDELRIPIDQCNTQMLLRQTFMDIAVVCEAFLNSTNTMEACLNLRRLVIHEAAMMDLLYGYEEETRDKKQWTEIKRLVPQSLIARAVGIEMLMSMLIIFIDKDKRHGFVHLYDDKGNARVKEFVDSMERLDFKYEMGVSTTVAMLYEQMMQFLADLMNTIAAKKHQEAEDSTKRLNEMFDSMIAAIQQAPVEEEKKQHNVEVIEGIKQRIKEIDTL